MPLEKRTTGRTAVGNTMKAASANFQIDVKYDRQYGDQARALAEDREQTVDAIIGDNVYVIDDARHHHAGRSAVEKRKRLVLQHFIQAAAHVERGFLDDIRIEIVGAEGGDCANDENHQQQEREKGRVPRLRLTVRLLVKRLIMRTIVPSLELSTTIAVSITST